MCVRVDNSGHNTSSKKAIALRQGAGTLLIINGVPTEMIRPIATADAPYA